MKLFSKIYRNISNLFASNETRVPKRDRKLLMIPLDCLNHVVLTSFNNLPFSLRAILVRDKHFKLLF